MEALQHQNEANERRVMSRIDAALRINYQIISEEMYFILFKNFGMSTSIQKISINKTYIHLH